MPPSHVFYLIVHHRIMLSGFMLLRRTPMAPTHSQIRLPVGDKIASHSPLPTKGKNTYYHSHDNDE